MLLNRRHWMLGAAALSTCPAARAFADDRTGKQTPLPVLTPAQIREDLAFLRTQWAPDEGSFSPAQRDAFERVVAEAIVNADASSPQDLVLDVMRALAIPRNGHTAPLAGPFLDALPVRAWWFPDGLYVLSAESGSIDLLGARIEKFGDLTAAEAAARAAPYISGTDQRIRYLSAAYLTSPMLLRRIGAAPKTGDVSLTVRLQDGRTRNVGLDAVKTPDPGRPREPRLTGWSVLIPDEKSLTGRWSHILDNVGQISPAYAKPTILSGQWLGAGEKVLYLRSNFIRSEPKESLSEGLLFGALQNRVVANRPRYVVVDLRLNNGGNYFETLLFAQALPKLMPRDGRVFVLVSRATFSAALVTALMLKRAGPDNVTLMGEHMGDEGQFWAEIQTKTLPNSKIPVLNSLKYGDYENGCPDLGKCYWPVTAFVQGKVSLEPDVKIDVSFADYAAGRDPVLEAALAMTK